MFLNSGRVCDVRGTCAIGLVPWGVRKDHFDGHTPSVDAPAGAPFMGFGSYADRGTRH